jgi:hypothetical protein
MRRYFTVIAAFLGVVVLTGASPIADLLARVEVLESAVVMLESENQTLLGQVSLLETQGQALLEQVASLEVESAAQPVVIDAGGNDIGKVVGFGDDGSSVVMLNFDGVPLFTIGIERDRFSTPSATAYYESGNCSGDVFAEMHGTGGGGPPRGLGGDTVQVLATGETWVIPADEPIGTRRLCSRRSWDMLSCEGIPCNNLGRMARATRIPEMEDFVPPFSLVTRGDLVAE